MSLYIYIYIYIYVCVCVCVCFIADPLHFRPLDPIFLRIGGRLSHFLFLYHFGGPQCKECISLSRKRYEDECTCKRCSVDVWLMNLKWGRFKVNGADISLLIKKHQGVTRFNVPIRRTIAINSTYAFTTYTLGKDLWFNLVKPR